MDNEGRECDALPPFFASVPCGCFLHQISESDILICVKQTAVSLLYLAQKSLHKTHSQGKWGAGETRETRNTGKTRETGKTRNTGETRKIGNPIPPIFPVLPVLPATLVTLVTPATPATLATLAIPATLAPLSVWALGAMLTRKRSPRFAQCNQGLRLSNCGA